MPILEEGDDVSCIATLAGLSAWIPPTVVTNHELSAALDSGDEWITQRTGIRERRWIRPGEATSDMAVAAAHSLVAEAAGPVDAVVVATMTPDHPCPATAPVVAARLGLRGAAAWDISIACAGFIYALASATALIRAGSMERVLVIGADAMSTVVDRHDRATAVVFADGAGAALLEAGRTGGSDAFGPFDLGSDGTKARLMEIPAGGSRQRIGSEGTQPGDHFIRMDGNQVFSRAVLEMTTSAATALNRANWTVGDVDWLIPHQANARIMTAVAERLGIPEQRRASNIHRVGNTAAASVPLVLADLYQHGRLQPGDRLLLTAFGAGLAWGSTTLTWPDHLRSRLSTTP